MAISPIQISNQSNSLVEILRGGSDVLTNIFDRAIQLGRDASDRRMRQEQDMMAMRQNETALAQRRTENLTRQIQDSQRFARSAFESDRRFNAEEERLGFERSYRDERDIIGDARYDEQFDYRTGRDEASDTFRERELGIRERSLASSETDDAEAKQRRMEIIGLLDTDVDTRTLDPTGLNETEANATAALRAAQQENDADGIARANKVLAGTSARRSQLESEQERIEAENKPLTPSEQRMQEKDDRDKAREESAKERENTAKFIATNAQAFPLHGDVEKTNFAKLSPDKQKEVLLSQGYTKKQIEKDGINLFSPSRSAASRDSVAVDAEIAAAKNAGSEEAYVNLLFKDRKRGAEGSSYNKPEILEARRKFYRMVMSGQGTTPASPSAPSPTDLDL
jgi:hypothetical protein